MPQLQLHADSAAGLSESTIFHQGFFVCEYVFHSVFYYLFICLSLSRFHASINIYMVFLVSAAFIVLLIYFFYMSIFFFGGIFTAFVYVYDIDMRLCVNLSITYVCNT